MTAKELRDYDQMYRALKRIAAYMSVAQLNRSANTKYGLDFVEAIGYAYENVLGEAKFGLRRVKAARLPQKKP